MDTVIDITIASSDAGERVDRLIARQLPELSRSRVKALIEGGHVFADGVTIANPSMRVKPEQTIRIAVPPPVEDRPVPQDLALPIVYEDDCLIVIDKPAGLVVHPAPGNPDMTLVNALLAHCGDSLAGIGGVRRPGIVHRLDKDTSGLMVVAKTERAHAHLSAAFADRTIERAYHAVVWGIPAPRAGEIDLPIGRSPVNRQKMAVVASGKPARTLYKVLRPLGLAASLVECRLKTGRTHQIRVHMTELGHPLIGDPVYGRMRTERLKQLTPEAAAAVSGFSRQALHACLLGFIHPENGASLSFTSAYPADLASLISFLE
jgi:23S rRNA pseudouridine1911/1915/1917 synthase